MSRIRDIAIERYAEHYARVNSNINPITAISPRQLQGLNLEYGALIASLPAGSKVLDLGCGTGFLLHWLSKQPSIVPYGVDGSASQVAIAHVSLPNIEISCADGLEYLRQHPNTFTAIFCMDVLEHLPSLDLCMEWIQAAQAALVPGGCFFCRVPNGANLTGSYSRYMDLTHERLFTSTSLLQLLELSSLQECAIVPIDSGRLVRRARLAVEHLLHRIIFLICAHPMERVFTSNVCAIGYRKS